MQIRHTFKQIRYLWLRRFNLRFVLLFLCRLPSHPGYVHGGIWLCLSDLLVWYSHLW